MSQRRGKNVSRVARISDCASEHQIQAAAFEVIQYRALSDARYKHIFAIPNGGYRAKSTGARLKREGTKKGVWDICIAIPSNEYHGAWIEVKSLEGKLTKEQIEFGQMMANVGYFCSVCFTPDEILWAIEVYLRPRQVI